MSPSSNSKRILSPALSTRPAGHRGLGLPPAWAAAAVARSRGRGSGALQEGAPAEASPAPRARPMELAGWGSQLFLQVLWGSEAPAPPSTSLTLF